jgi:hypothetical protein
MYRATSGSRLYSYLALASAGFGRRRTSRSVVITSGAVYTILGEA